MTSASIWYGKRDEEKYCKKAACMCAGGYLAPKKLKGVAAKRARVQAVKEESDEEILGEYPLGVCASHVCCPWGGVESCNCLWP